ncbi:hypothetical protein BCT07_17825 [Vibrio breoganii]|uniref:hypothetical protein n=1 Tax=Vibrio breoganii TaxID=553239 RepID=UPI000C837258|nr:hypothetical protein [Vibrio breoganii]PMO53143.1 hypothetical protein BCT07_17825 [Vibrio breoganii]
MNKELLNVTDLKDQLPIPIASIDYASLETMASSKGCTLEQVGRRLISNVVVVRSSNGEYRELWVSPSYRDYTVAWKAVFGPVSNIHQRWQAVATSSTSSTYHLDHVLSSAIATKITYAYVRLFPVIGSVNMHFGRSFEGKIKTNLTAGAPLNRPNYDNGIEYLDILGLGKVLNFELHHVQFKANNQYPQHNQEFLKHYSKLQATKNTLKKIGVVWW